MLPVLTRRSFSSLAACGLLGTVSARADDSGAPGGKPILSISGRIARSSDGDAAQFDRPMLEAIGMTCFVTSCPWYGSPVRFEGVPMARLMEAVGASGAKVTAVALDDYSTEIPMADFTTYGVILALKRDGKYMSVQDKGPLFIVYPYDSAPELQTRKFYSRSAWQVAQLVVG